MTRRSMARTVTNWGLAAGVSAVFCVLAPLPSQAQGVGGNSQANARASLAVLETSLTELIATAEVSVVAVVRLPSNQDQADTPFSEFGADPFSFGTAEAQAERFQPSGAGVVIDADGLILTQYLNVRPGDDHMVVTTDDRRLPAKIKGADPRSGLAVLEVEASGLPALALGDADQVRKGHLLVTIGNPQAIIADGEPTASWGMVANLAQSAAPTANLNNTMDENGMTYATTLHHLGTLMQLDARLNWASGGGAVVNLRGELVGLTTTLGTLPGHEAPAGYAIPMTSTFRRVVEELKAGKEVEYGLLGLTLRPADARVDREARGAVVTQTLGGSAAERAGIQADDRLVQIDGQPIDSVADLQLLVGGLPPSMPVSVGLVRSGRRLDLSLALTKYHVRGEKVITSGKRSWRGLQVDYSTAANLTDLRAAATQSLIDPEGCVLVANVEPGSAADAAGVRPGMFVSHVGDRRVTTPDEFYAAVEGAEETVQLRFTDDAGRTEQEEREVEAAVPPAAGTDGDQR